MTLIKIIKLINYRIWDEHQQKKHVNLAMLKNLSELCNCKEIDNFIEANKYFEAVEGITIDGLVDIKYIVKGGLDKI